MKIKNENMKDFEEMDEEVRQKVYELFDEVVGRKSVAKAIRYFNGDHEEVYKKVDEAKFKKMEVMEKIRWNEGYRYREEIATSTGESVSSITRNLDVLSEFGIFEKGRAAGGKIVYTYNREFNKVLSELASFV